MQGGGLEELEVGVALLRCALKGVQFGEKVPIGLVRWQPRFCHRGVVYWPSCHWWH